MGCVMACNMRIEVMLNDGMMFTGRMDSKPFGDDGSCVRFLIRDEVKVYSLRDVKWFFVHNLDSAD